MSEVTVKMSCYDPQTLVI